MSAYAGIALEVIMLQLLQCLVLLLALLGSFAVGRWSRCERAGDIVFWAFTAIVYLGAGALVAWRHW